MFSYEEFQKEKGKIKPGTQFDTVRKIESTLTDPENGFKRSTYINVGHFMKFVRRTSDGNYVMNYGGDEILISNSDFTISLMKHDLNESVQSNTELLQSIEKDLKGFRIRLDDIEIHKNTVNGSIRDLGRWVHDEEDAYYREEDGDMDWREDDDQEIWAPGEHKKYFEQFQSWANNHSWIKKVNLKVYTGEKNYAYFSIEVK